MNREKIIEDAVVLLVKNNLGTDAITEVADMAYRALCARNNPTWWEVVGRPDYNRRLAQIRQRIENEND